MVDSIHGQKLWMWNCWIEIHVFMAKNMDVELVHISVFMD